MDVLVDRCAGIDIGKADVKVCVRTPGARRGTRHSEVRTFMTTTNGLLLARDWLVEQRVSRVGMESTGVYWKPVFFLLEDAVECWLLNAGHLKKVPGRKSDVSDAQWIAQLVECGLVQPSLVPPQPIRRLRDLTRYRATLVHERTREVQRLHAVLEDACIKLDCVASDIMGVSGRSMIEALIAGNRDPVKLAELARTKLRVKIPALQEALTGRFSDHHGFLCRLMLDRIDQIDATLAELHSQIEDHIAPFRHLRDRLITIPGVNRVVAEVIIAETGGDMARFASPPSAVLVGRDVPREQRVRRQTLLHQDPQRRHLAPRRTRPSRRQRSPHQEHLPRSPLPTTRRPPRQETSSGRGRTLHPRSRLVCHDPRRRLRRPRPRALQPHRRHQPESPIPSQTTTRPRLRRLPRTPRGLITPAHYFRLNREESVSR